MPDPNDPAGMPIAPKQPGSKTLPSDRDPAKWLSFFFAAICGFLLIAVGVFSPRSDVDMLRYRWPILAVGLAIIMGAVGAQVSVSYKWVTAAGAAAMVLIFARVFPISPPAPP